MKTTFINEQESHAHSLETLEALYQYDDFMLSVQTLVDMGCGSGLDLEWWATRTTRDELETPLNIRCTGVDVNDTLPMATRYKNISYSKFDFETNLLKKNKFDLLWCHDAFQYVINPIQTLSQWWDILNQDGMLVLILPQTTNLVYNKQEFTQQSNVYYHWTLVNLIHMLALSGFDCKAGFFSKKRDDNWLHAVVYKSEHAPMDPKTTTWYDLVDKGLLPSSADAGILKYGFLRQQDLILPWLDKTLDTFKEH